MAMMNEYINSDVGVIPQDWSVFELQVLAERISVGLATSVTKYYRPFGTPIIRNLNIRRGYFENDSMLYLDIEFAKANISKAVREYDVLTVRTGSNLGDTCVVPASYDLCQTFTTLITRPRKSCLDAHFLCCHMTSTAGIKEMDRLQAGGAKGNLNTSELKKYRIALPPTLSEQESISKALSDTDAWIESIEQLIAKKRQVKRGAMQELLTGKRRLPGFRGEWKLKRLEELGTFTKGSGVTKSQSNSGELPCIRYGEIYTRHTDYIRAFYSSISRAVAATATAIKRGDLLFAGSGETKEEIGKCVAFVHDCQAYAGGDIVVLRTSAGDPVFLGYLLNTAPFARQKASRGQGDAVVHISASALSSICGHFPEDEEQRAIGNVLLEMDSEIIELESKLTKAHQIKQSMMQELLTGRIRLVKPTASTVSMQEAVHA